MADQKLTAGDTYPLDGSHPSIRDTTRQFDPFILGVVLVLIVYVVWKRVREVRAESAEIRALEAGIVDGEVVEDAL